MQYTLTTREDTPVIGYTMLAKPQDPEIPKFWGKVHESGDFARLMEKSKRGENFGLCIMDQGEDTDVFTYMIAVDHDQEKPIDPDMKKYTVKGGEYAVFRAPDMASIAPMFTDIYKNWLPNSPYQFNKERNADFEYYTMDGKNVLCDIYVPVTKK